MMSATTITTTTTINTATAAFTGSIRPLKLAYLILVHTPDSVLASQRLMTAIWRPDFYYLYVVDREMSDQGRRALAEYLASPDAAVFRARGNVRVMQANVRAGWGSMGLVQNELDGLAELVRAHDDWDYALAVSGDTYPLVSQERLVERLAYWRRRGANFVCDDGKKPQRNQHVQAHKSARLAKLAWPTGVTEPDQFGSQWFTLTREFVEYTLTSTFARNVLMAMAQVEIPDESFFQVLLMNSHFNNTVGLVPPAPTSQICRYITWDKCNYEKKGIHMWPCFFGPKDFAAMTASDCVFTRKLLPDVSGDLYDMLDQHMATAV